ncbi:MAG: DUF4252 domain-containing protein [Bacteroidota bacterium]
MKTSIISLLLIFFTTSLQAQTTTFERMLDATAHIEERQTFNLSGSWLSSMTEDKSMDSHLESLQLLSVARSDWADMPDLNWMLERDGYELMTQTRSGDTRMEILIKETEVGITDVFYWSTDEEDVSLIHINGLLLLHEIEDLDVQGL